MAAIPGLAQVLGVAASLLYRALDPRKKKERLLDAKEKILKGPHAPDRADKLGLIDGELLKVQREIDRRAGD